MRADHPDIRRLPPVVIVAIPAGAGRFIPHYDGQPLCGPTAEPFLDGCRALITLGISREAVAVMRHAGSDVDCLRARVGYAAARTVMEDGVTGPRLVRWKAPQACVDRPPVAQNPGCLVPSHLIVGAA